MKTPTAKKLPSGRWFCRVRVDGNDISITRDTKKEAIAEAMAIKAGIKKPELRISHTTLTKAIDSYIEARKNVLSPSTIRGYRAIQKLRFKTMMHREIDKISPNQWQSAVNLEAQTVSAKTLKNSWAFIASVIAEATGQRITVRLPQIIAKDLPFLTPEQIPIFLSAIKGSPYEIPILLGIHSLRRSEIFAVKWGAIDLENDCIYVRGAAVINDKGKLVQREENKNTTSRRTIPFIIPQLRAAVEAADKSSEYVCNCNPNTLWQVTNRICRSAGLPEVGVHGLRRSFASLAYHLRLSEEVTMRVGGWSDIYTMRKIYTKVSEKDIKDQSAKFASFFNFDNENGNGEKNA